jgi:uncharacterized membrane protein YhiD involved in acid resistance
MNANPAAPLSLPVMILNLGLGIFLSLLVALYYTRYGQSLSNRRQFASILPLLTLITLLVITVVKSSLALSLGLVGALSIVRFRTAIKDPEELIFLFLAIAIGLGLGADQRIPTLAAVGVILAFLLIRAFTRSRSPSTHSLYLNVEMENDLPSGDLFSRLNKLLLDEVSQVDLRRLDSQGTHMQATYYLYLKDPQKIVRIMNQLKEQLPGCTVSMVEQNHLLGE